MCRGEKACTLPLPSCKDTGHTLASLEHRSGPVSSLRHTAERSRGLTSKAQCVFTFLDGHRKPSSPHLCLSTIGVLLWAGTAAPFPLFITLAPS